MYHPARPELLDVRRIFEVVGVFRFLLGVEVVERAHELVEPVHGGERVVGVAEMVFAELRGHVALRLEQLGNGDVTRHQAFLSAGQTDFQKAGAVAALAGDKARAPGGATLLPIPVGVKRPLLRDAVDVGRLVAHHPHVVAARIEPADVVAPDDEDVRLLRLLGGSFVCGGNGDKHARAQCEHGEERDEFAHKVYQKKDWAECLAPEKPVPLLGKKTLARLAPAGKQGMESAQAAARDLSSDLEVEERSLG